MPDAYAEDLAYIHDVGFGAFSRNAAPELLALMQQQGLTDGRVVDLGCGSGIWASVLAEAGYDVTGIDISSAMIELARARVPDGTFHVGSFLEVALPPCVAVTALGECFNYLFDPSNSRTTLRNLFRRIYEALQPDGLLIFDVAEPGRGAGSRMKNWETDDWAILVNVEEDEATQQLTRHITTFRNTGTCWRRHHETHRQQLYRGTDLAADLRRIGFRVRLVRGYGPHRFPSKAWVGIIARKA